MAEKKNGGFTTKRIAGFGLMISLAFIFSYIESLFPIYLGIPGAKPGFANIVTVLSLYIFGVFGAFSISITRVILAGFTFGNLYSIFYSLTGALLSFIGMSVLKKTKKFTIIGISAAGGMLHNIGQWLIAMMILGKAVFYYFPFLISVGVVTGIFVGLLGAMVYRSVSKLKV